MGDIDRAIVKFVSALTLLALFLSASVVCYGWIISSYWHWFIVPLGAAPIGFWHAAGIAMGLRSLHWTLSDVDNKAKPPNNGMKILVLSVASGLAWSFGAVIHSLAF